MNLTPQAALANTETLMLDMDGTLLDLAFDNLMWRELVPQRYARMNGMAVDAAIDDLMARYAAVQGELEWYCLDHWSDRLGFDVVQMHHDMQHRIGYLPGAKQFLEDVAARDMRVLLVTNSHPGTLALKDAVTRLGDYFDGIYSSHEIGHAKEKQPFWQGLAAEIDFDPATTLFIDDSASVLASARDYGIGMLLNVTRPDTTRPQQHNGDFAGIERVADLLG